MPLEHVHRLIVIDAPNADNTIGIPRGDALAVRAERDAVEPRPVIAKVPDFLPVGPVPLPGRAVRIPRHDPFAIGAELQTGHVGHAAAEVSDLLAGGGVPDTNGRVAAAAANGD